MMVGDIEPLYTWVPEIYYEMMSPIKIEPIRERALNYFFWNLGMTMTWPIATPASIIWAMQKELRGKGCSSDIYFVSRCLRAPISLFVDSKEYLAKKTEALKFSNIDELLENGTIVEGPDGINPGIRFRTGDNGKKDNPYRFGDMTSDNHKYGYLELIFPDNLMLNDFYAMYFATANRENPGNWYLNCEYFLRVDPKDTRRLYEEFEKVKRPNFNDLRR